MSFNDNNIYKIIQENQKLIVIGIISSIILLMGIVGTAIFVPKPLHGYNLVWEDEFIGHLDPTWEMITNSNESWWNCTTADNINIENGNLILRLKDFPCSDDSSRNYTAGAIRTKRSWLYGYFEVKAKLAYGSGINSAFWLTGHDWYWPPEIGVYETPGNDSIPNIDYMTYHWGTSNQNYQIQGIYVGPDLSQDFHIYGMEWTKTYIRWLVDGEEKYRISSDSVPIPDVAMQVILSIGEGWNDLPDRSILPQYHSIQYIRVYQKL